MDRFPDSLIAFQRIRSRTTTPARRGSPRCAGPRASNARAAVMITAGRYAARPTRSSARAAIEPDLGDGGDRILHGSKLALTVWFWAAYLMATHLNGIAALQLQNQLVGSVLIAAPGCSQAKLRKAMVDPERDPLSGLIEVDETAPGVPRPRMIPWPAAPGAVWFDGKLLVVGAVEVIGDGNAPGRLRLA